MKNILLLTDFTAKSYNAHDYALQYYTGQPCTFHVMSVQKYWEYTMDDLMVANPEDDVMTALLGDNELQLKATETELVKRSTSEPFTFHTIATYDVFTDAINNAVTKNDIELIVCGTDGKSGLIEAIFSSHTLRIMRNIECPLLAIPEGFVFQPPAVIAYILAFEDVFDACGKERLQELTNTYESIIHVLRFNDGVVMEPADYDQEQKDIATNFSDNYVHYEAYPTDEPVAVIERAIAYNGIQLLALSAHKESFLERMFSDSHLSEIVNAATVPLLILHDCNP
jgi:nucleotide-binding universal stress UspA family protein